MRRMFAALTVALAMVGCQPQFDSTYGGACSPDIYEPDDEIETAVLLEDDTVIERVACPGERDLLEMPGEISDIIRVHLIWEGEEGDLELRFRDENGDWDYVTTTPRPGHRRFTMASCSSLHRYLTVTAPETEISYLAWVDVYSDSCVDQGD